MHTHTHLNHQGVRRNVLVIQRSRSTRFRRGPSEPVLLTVVIARARNEDVVDHWLGGVDGGSKRLQVADRKDVRACQYRSEGGEEQVDTTATITNLRWPAADKVGDEEGAFAALNASTQPTGAVDVAVEARALVAPQNAVGRT